MTLIKTQYVLLRSQFAAITSNIGISVDNNPALGSDPDQLTDLDPATCGLVTSTTLARDTVLSVTVSYITSYVQINLKISDFDCTDRSLFLAYRHSDVSINNLYTECDVIPAMPENCIVMCKCDNKVPECQKVFLHFRKPVSAVSEELLCDFQIRVK